MDDLVKNRINIMEFESGKNFMSGKTVEEMQSSAQSSQCKPRFG